MIKIDAGNKTGEIRLHKNIYKTNAINDSITAFKDFFDAELVEDGEHNLVKIKFNDALDAVLYEKTCYEFCNHVFGLMKNEA